MCGCENHGQSQKTQTVIKCFFAYCFQTYFESLIHQILYNLNETGGIQMLPHICSVRYTKEIINMYISGAEDPEGVLNHQHFYMGLWELLSTRLLIY